MIAAVIESHDPRTPATIAAFGADVFVTDSFMADARAGREPGLTERLIRCELYGKTTPIMRRNAIALNNAGSGLNVIVIHVAAPESQLSDTTQEIRFNVLQAFMWAHRGYRLKEALQEVWDEGDLEWVQSWGKLRSDYSDFYDKNRLAKPRPRPLLFGISREEWLERPASIAGSMFMYTPPRFQFSEGAQELLAGALEGDTDIALANDLHISLSAVKMRWRVIYERVQSVAPELFVTQTARISESSRGKEKRRCVVEYVRNHPEELRPYTASSDQELRPGSTRSRNV